jgi:hypothetical protein
MSSSPPFAAKPRCPPRVFKVSAARTSGQMRLFAKVLRRGDFYGARIDRHCRIVSRCRGS